MELPLPWSKLPQALQHVFPLRLPNKSEFRVWKRCSISSLFTIPAPSLKLYRCLCLHLWSFPLVQDGGRQTAHELCAPLSSSCCERHWRTDSSLQKTRYIHKMKINSMKTKKNIYLQEHLTCGTGLFPWVHGGSSATVSTGAAVHIYPSNLIISINNFNSRW